VGVLSEYATVPSVSAKEVKSITPFEGYSNRHGLSAIINDNETEKVIVKIVDQDVLSTKICPQLKCNKYRIR